MSDPKRLVILKALCAHLESITPDNGYVNDLSPISAAEPRVYRGRAVFSEADPLPCVSILEAPIPDTEPARAGSGLYQRDQWVLLINGWAKNRSDDPHPSDAAHYLMADVKKAIGKLLIDDASTYMLGGVIDDLAVEPGVVRPPDETSERAYFYLRIVIGVAERLDDPTAV